MKKHYFQKCQLKDLPALQEISIETWNATYRHMNTEKDSIKHLAFAFSKNQLTKELQDPNSEFYFLFWDKKIIGYLRLNELDAQTEEMATHCYEIERIYLKKEFQGQGFGKILIDKAVEVAISKGKKEVWLGVWEKNPEAIGFYKKMGFEIFGKHIFKVGDDEQTDYMMKKII